MRFSELLEHCITCIKTFNPVIKTIDSHADEYIANVSHFLFFSLYLTNLTAIFCCENRWKILMKKYSLSKFSTVAPDTKNSSRYVNLFCILQILSLGIQIS